MANNKKSTTKKNVKQFPIKLKKGLKSQGSQPVNASPSKSAALASKCRTPRKDKSAEPTVLIAPTNADTCQRRSSPRFKAAAEPTNSTPLSSAHPETDQRTPHTRKKLASKTKTVPAATKSKEDDANSKGKAVKRKLDTSTGPCPTIQLRNPNDTFSDFEDDEDDETLHTNQDVQEEEPDVDSDEGKDDDDCDETGGGKELEKDDNGSDDKLEEEVVVPSKRRKSVPRGPTQMHAMRLDSTDPKAEVPFNYKDQPVGKPSVQLASCLGVLVRRNISLTHNDWRLVPAQAKANIWKVIQHRFIVPEHYQDYYFAKMGAYLKESRSRKAGLVLQAFDNLQGEERDKRIASLMPTSMCVSEWSKFVKRVASPEFRVKRLQMQQIRAKHDTPHTIGREGYARLEAKMQKEMNTTEPLDRADVWVTGHKPSEGKEPSPSVLSAFKKIEEAQASGSGSSLTDDVLTRALGEDKGVRLKGMGFGATRKKIAANSHYKSIINNLSDRLSKLEENSSKCVCSSVLSHTDSPVASNNVASTRRVAPCSASTPTTSPVSISVRDKVPERFTPCKLLSWYKEGEVVADAKISETDPSEEIHGDPIGFGAYTVCVMICHVEGARVFKRTTEFRFVSDAVGSIIPWPKDRIVFD